MKKIMFLILLAFIGNLRIFSQNVEKYDTIVNEQIYRSYYSYKIKGASFVVYRLYKGGGKNSRVGMNFKSSFPHFLYRGSGYDIGHLANAEDFAYDRVLEEKTFRFYNAVPQTPNLNRGIWKSYETKIRKLSQSDSLLIVCGGCDYANLIPSSCFKIVYDLREKKIVYSLLFTNSSRASFRDDDKLILIIKSLKVPELINIF